MDSLIGQQLGKYLIQAEIGHGGMGVVYRGHDPALQRTVAIKVLPPQLTLDREFIQRFHQEAVMAANLHHPNIVTIYDIGEQDGVHFIVMEHLAGVTLDRWITEQGQVSLAQADNVIYQVCHALDYAHGRRMVHRDIKPSNIMIGPEDHATLMDFGLARAGEDSGLTRSGVVVGTAEYMAPEHALGGKIDGRSDVYSFGVVIYKMLTGTVPFSRSSSYAVSYAHIYEPPPLLRQTRPDLPPAIEAVVLKALAKEPADRYQKAGHLARDFAAAVSGETPTDLERWLTPIVRAPEMQPRQTSPSQTERPAGGSVTEPMERRAPQRQPTTDPDATQPMERQPRPRQKSGKNVTEAMEKRPLHVGARPVMVKQPEPPRKRRLIAPLFGIVAVVILASITGLVLAFGRPDNGTPSPARGGSDQNGLLTIPPSLLPTRVGASPARPGGVLVETQGSIPTVEVSIPLTPTVTLVPTVTPTETETKTSTPKPAATRPTAIAIATATLLTPTRSTVSTDTPTPQPWNSQPPTSEPQAPTVAPPTPRPPTAAPSTAVPPTSRPPTAVPPTAMPPTAAPPTAVPPTPRPPTAVPPTVIPPTAAPTTKPPIPTKPIVVSPFPTIDR